MTGYWHNPVDCLSVSDAVHCGSQGYNVYRAKICARVFQTGRHVPICLFRHFCCRMYRLATKRTAKKRIEENASVSFFQTHTIRPRVYCFIAHYLLLRTVNSVSSTLVVTLEWI